MSRRYLRSGGDADVELRFTSLLETALTDDLRRVAKACGDRTRALARAAAPVGKTGQLRNAILTKQFDDGNVSVFVGTMRDRTAHSTIRNRATYNARERADNFPLWIEYGTAKMNPRPFLLPAGEAVKAEFERETANVVLRVSQAG
jgi:HK97 gp10 family phage protein